MKFLVLSLLVVAASAVPTSYNKYGATYGQSFSSSSVAPRFGLVGLNSGYSGVSSGLFGTTGLNYGSSTRYVAAAQPAVQYVAIAQPAVQNSYVAVAQPAVQTVAYARPAVQNYVAVAQPAVQATYVQAAPVQTSYVHSAAPAVQNFGVQHQSHNFEAVVPAAVNQVSRTVEYRAAPHSEQPIQAQTVEIEASDNPVHLHFKTRSSSLSTSQSHQAAPATEVQTASERDEPQRLITEVQKPVIQEVREVITPFRQVTQEISPVQESLHTIVTKGEAQREQYVAKQQNYQVARQQNYQTVAVQAAPAYQTVAVQAAPAVQHVQTVHAAPAYQTVAVQAAPAVQTVQAVHAAPAYQTVAVEAVPAVQHHQYSTVQAAPISYQQVSAVESVAPAVSYQTVAAAPAYSQTQFVSAPVESRFAHQQQHGKASFVEKHVTLNREQPSVASTSYTTGY